jgi:hypothetical protein
MCIATFELARNKTFIRAVLLFTEFNSPPNLVRDKGIYSTRAGSMLTSVRALEYIENAALQRGTQPSSDLRIAFKRNFGIAQSRIRQ